MTRNIVIIGAGHAGVQAAASLREEGFSGRLTLVSEEPDLPYHKPPLSKTFIKGEKAEPQPLRGEAFYTGHDIRLDLGRRVERLDLTRKRVDFVGGASLAYDALVLATGSHPRALPLPGAGDANVVALRTLADARKIRMVAAEARDVAVIGAGFIGLEIAATLAGDGRAVTVVEALERPLARGVAKPIAAHVANRLAASGVRLITDARIDRLIVDQGKVTAVELASGERIAADLTIAGIGVLPATQLAEQAGLDVGNGIRIDGSMRTSAADVFAVGDCTNYRHWMTGTDVRLESVQNATDQARLAARTILGHSGSYDSVPWFWSDIGDMKLQMVGLVGSEDRSVTVGNPDDNRFSIFHFAGARLTAIESVNRPADHMLGRRMLAAGFSPDPEALRANPDGLKGAFAAWQVRVSA